MTKRLLYTCRLFFLIATTFSLSANDFFTSYNVLSAYHKVIEGNSVFYPLNFHPSERALLVDAKDNVQIKWESEDIPNFYGDQKLKFAFTYSISNALGEMPSYELSMDSIHTVDFEFIENVPFSHSNNGLEIEFIQKESPEPNIQSGVGIISIPIEFLSPGNPINFILKTTQPNGGDSWLMIYQNEFKQGINFFDSDIVIKKDGEYFREFGVAVNNFGNEQNINIRIDGNNNEFSAENGISYHPIYLSKNTSPRELEIEILVNDSIVSFERHRLATIKTKNIYLLNESYSYNSILLNGVDAEVQLLKQALELTAGNDQRDLLSKFKWSTFEFETIQKYLDYASEEERIFLMDRIKNGLIELSPAYKQIISSLSTPVEYSYLFEDGLHYAAKAGQEKLGQIQIDPSGISANYMEYLLDRGITEIGLFQNSEYQIRPEYFNSQKKPYFYQSHYKTKDLLVYNQNDGIYYGKEQQPISNYSISRHLQNLANRNIKYPNSLLRLIPTDAFINRELSEVVREWNASHQSPKLIISTFSQFANQFRKTSGNKLKGVRTLNSPFWEEAILNYYPEYASLNQQFHDLRVNECIGVIQKEYSDRNDLKHCMDNFWKIRQNTIQKNFLFPNSDSLSSDFEVKTIDARNLVIYNPISTPRGGAIALSISNNYKGAKNKKGKIIPFQRINDGIALLQLNEIPAYGYEEITLMQSANRIVGNYPKFKISFNNKRGIYALKAPGKDENLIKAKSELFALVLVDGGHPNNNTIQEEQREIIKIKDGPLCTTYKVYSKLNGIKCEKTIYLYHTNQEIKVDIQLDNLPESDYSVHMNWPLNIPSNDFKTDCQLFELDKSEYNKKGNLNFFGSQFLCIKNQHIQADIYSSNPAFWQIGEMAVTPSKYGWRSQMGFNNKFISYLTSNYFGYKKQIQNSYKNEFTVSFSSNDKAIEAYFLHKQYPLIALENVYTNRQSALFDWDNENVYIQKMYPHEGGQGIVLEMKNKSHEPQKMSLDWNGKRKYKVYEIDNSDKKTGILRGNLNWNSYQLIRVLLE